jgi:pterin-4a-carbinolamine dehydratase
MSQWAAPGSYIRRARGANRGIGPESALRRRLRSHPQWCVIGQRLVREWRFKDFTEAFGFVERLASDVEDVGRRPDICLLAGNRVRVTVANPNHAGVTVAELRMVGKVEAAAERYVAGLASGASASETAADSHEHPLGA